MLMAIIKGMLVATIMVIILRKELQQLSLQIILQKGLRQQKVHQLSLQLIRQKVQGQVQVHQRSLLQVRQKVLQQKAHPQHHHQLTNHLSHHVQVAGEEVDEENSFLFALK